MRINHIHNGLETIFFHKMMAGLKPRMFFWRATACRNAGQLKIFSKLLNWALAPV